MDFYQYMNNFSYDVGGPVARSNELILITTMVIFGTPVGLFFLFTILKFTPSFRVFILLSLFHYAAILDPLIIYLVFMFENNIRQI